MKLVAAMAMYNESENIVRQLDMLAPFVDGFVIVDDDSTDYSVDVASVWLDTQCGYYPHVCESIPHTGLPETVKKKALEFISDGDWVIMLDFDEKISAQELQKIREWIDTNPTQSHMYFSLKEFIDGRPAREFVKCRLYKKEAVNFSPRIHEDESFSGEAINIGLTVIHSKTTSKQVGREKEYIETYKKLLSEGKITEDRYRTMVGYHYFIHE
jgi:glycosyltransferase involved in cell wall biosynthesis